MSDEVEIVEGELVPAGQRLPELGPTYEAGPGRPVVDWHTVLRPGELPATLATPPAYTEADFSISQATAHRMGRSKAHNTNRNYAAQRKRFAQWCAERGRVARPCTTATFIEYAGYLIEERRLAPASVEAIMSAVRTWQPEEARPGRQQVKEMIASWAREWVDEGNRPDQGAPILIPELRAMLATCQSLHPADLRDGALLSLGWSMLCRRSELADRTIKDVVVVDDGVMVYFARSKTDQAARGRKSFAPADPDPLLDPVRYMRAWLEWLAGRGIRDGALFRALTVAGTLQSRASATKRGDFLTGDAIGAIVKRRAARAGLPNWWEIRAHGLRSGPATELAAAGADEDDIAWQGRWKKGSRVVRERYIRPVMDRRENPMRRLAEHRRKQREQQQ